MSSANRTADGRPRFVERAARRAVALTGLAGHAEALGVAGRAAAVDRWLIAAGRSPPVGSSQWVVLSTCFAVLSGVGLEMATLLVAATALPSEVTLGGLGWQPLLAVWTFGPPACAAAFLWWLREDPFARPAAMQWVVDAALAVAVALGVLTMGLPSSAVDLHVWGMPVTLYWPSLAGIAAIPLSCAAWLGLRCTPGGSEVSVGEVVALSALSLAVVLGLHLLTPLPSVFI